MRKLVGNIRATFYYAVLGIFSIPFLLATPLLWVFTPRGWFSGVIAYLDTMSFLLRHLCHIDYVVEGRENIPDGPVLFASRHESTWEVMQYHKVFDKPVILAKRAVFGYPFGGRVATLCGHIPIGRDGDLDALRDAFARAVAAVRAGNRLLIFPAGTRNLGERDRIRSGVAGLYTLLDVPCVPVMIDSGTCWPTRTWAKYPGTIHVRILPPIEAGLSKAEFLDRLRTALNATA